MDTTEILITIRRIVRSINLESKKIQKEYGVSIPQLLCLSYLHASRNFQSTQGEIRRFLNLNSSTTSGIIDRLENKGCLARLPKQGDKRVVNIALTSKGSELLKQVPPLLHDRLSERLQSLSSMKLQQIQESLLTLVHILDIEQVEASPMLTIEEPIEETKKK
ncbi:MarR family winged helix-turn-helix transcriptional regulator [Sunxiuqinia elliptica]|uniref:MarR family transcriptional regulator n=1 Tax=Sunxiuqinia elliptica TaxID=655355 RepID=A0A4R6GND2_9BACT|nr:MarR family transcriptional regulator [Sunxiuqinia elliptica]TDN96741.1 MarR family transcriptional regulator [Sunxiuqinia elliptica]TDO55700.1 MarR family transcriptional regulator [Sunxiuqinia elliptica]